MATWAVIKSGGKQYKVAEGDTVSIETIDGDKDAKITFDQILAIGGDKVAIGAPLVDKAKVNGKVVENYRAKKIRVVKFRAKSKYLRQTGHRQNLTKVLIENIQV